MKIRFLKTYSSYRPGDVVECDEDVARRLIADERAVEVRAEPKLIETAAVEPVAESADLTPRRRHKEGR